VVDGHQLADDDLSRTAMAGTADCEVRDNWFLEQDVNAWSSLAYVVAGMVLAAQVARHRLPTAVYALAAVVAAEGVGSLLFHGAAGDVSQFLHDVPLIGALGFVAGWHTGRLVGATDRGSLIGLVAGLVTASVLWAAAPGATNATVAVAIVVIVAASVVARRRGLAGVWSPALLVLGIVAVAMWVLGSPDSPLCNTDSLFQPHAIWHVLTAVLALAWVDSAYAAADPDHAPRMFRRFTDRTIGMLAVGLVLGFHRSVDVAWRERFPTNRPVLIVANHANGFVDPVVVAAVLHRLPRFLAKAALWKVVIARPFLGLAGVLPVYRRADGDRASNNASVFEACHRELAQGATVAIFPEGTTGDRAGLDRVKSGAARIALGAVPTAPDLVIVPIGMAYESKVETRSRVAVMFGEPIVVADFAEHEFGSDGEPHHADAHALTEQITASLQAVSPGFADVEEREILRAAAGIERSDHSDSSFADTEVVARRLATAPAEARSTIVGAYRLFASRLQLINITDDQLRPEHVSVGRIAVSLLALLFGGSLVVAATLIHLPAILIVTIGTGLVRSTATKGTVRLLLGLVTALLTWIIAGAWLGDGWSAVAYAIAVAFGGLVALIVWPPLVRQFRVLTGMVRVRDRSGLLGPVLEARSHVVTLVRANIGDSHD
jgi:glycerol-3-phosphate O-acyltransferase/dihydroxyacetone phosphate acyltransferase